MKVYNTQVNKWAFAPISANAAFLAVEILLLYPVPMLLKRLPVFAPAVSVLDIAAGALLIAAAVLLLLAGLIEAMTPPAEKVKRMVCRGLFDPARGNPLSLRGGELLPRVRCKCVGEGRYDLNISAQQGVTVETIRKAAPAISAALSRHFQRYAVVAAAQDTAYNCVTFRLEDVKVDHCITYHNVEVMRPERPTLLTVQNNVSIDLTTSGSMLVAGKTRSGKTTGVISLLLQVLLSGQDKFGSLVNIIDPKRAELSRLPHTITIDDDGEVRAIVETLRTFAETVTQRQEILNGLSDKKGDAVKWYDAGMKPSFLFIDEYVALRSILPKKAAKDDEGYSLDAFDGLLKRIVTMGASAGCFVIISVAEASVQEGGLPAMLRSAMSTRVLFRPTMAEARLIWDKEKLETMPNSMVCGPGDAWFSSTDGVHEAVNYVRFPRLKFPAYRELGRLLKQYYEADAGGGGSEADATPSTLPRI
ncbi:MAG: hypothetical protein K1W04_08700 [Oscillospiraceae bacterium]